jgi:hypothetical protein
MLCYVISRTGQLPCNIVAFYTKWKIPSMLLAPWLHHLKLECLWGSLHIRTSR